MKEKFLFAKLFTQTASKEGEEVNYAKRILSEMEAVCELVNQKEVTQSAELIIQANRVLVVGVGRVLISLKAWVKRLRHLGIDINYVGSETEAAVLKGDLLIVASSSGESIIPVKIAEKAKSLKVDVLYIGSNPDSSAGTLADYSLRIPCKTKLGLPDEFHSFQPMSTLFEQVLYIMGDALTYEIMDRMTFNEEEIKNNHANLE